MTSLGDTLVECEMCGKHILIPVVLVDNGLNNKGELVVQVSVDKEKFNAHLTQHIRDYHHD